MRLPTTPSQAFALFLGGKPVHPLALLRADVFLAADRPDRLEARFLEPGGGPGALDLFDTESGAKANVSIGDREVFSGRVERVAWSAAAAEGRALSIIAYADYHRLRARCSPRRHSQATDSEVALAIAAGLGLAPSVGAVREVESMIEVDGDPLRFLRRRARRRGFQLAVTRGRLYFGPEAPPIGVPAALGLGDILSIDVERRGSRGGSFAAPGDPRWSPLAAFEVEGAGRLASGRYRAVRALHTIDATGYRTRVEFLEDGVDWERWLGAANAEEAHGLPD